MFEPMKPAPPMTRYFNLPPGAPEHGADGTQNNLEIHREGSVLDIVKIVFQFDGGLRYTGNISIVDLCPTGETRLHQQARPIEGNLFLVIGHQFRNFCTRPHQTHFTAQDVPKLRQLIETGPSQKATDTRHAWIVL